jgi:hypothetical protein
MTTSAQYRNLSVATLWQRIGCVNAGPSSTGQDSSQGGPTSTMTITTH